MSKVDAAGIEDSIGVGLDHRTIRVSITFNEVPKENLNKKRRRAVGRGWESTDHKAYKLYVTSRIRQLKGKSFSEWTNAGAEHKCKVIGNDGIRSC